MKRQKNEKKKQKNAEQFNALQQTDVRANDIFIQIMCNLHFVFNCRLTYLRLLGDRNNQKKKLRVASDDKVESSISTRCFLFYAPAICSLEKLPAETNIRQNCNQLRWPV